MSPSLIFEVIAIQAIIVYLEGLFLPIFHANSAHIRNVLGLAMVFCGNIMFFIVESSVTDIAIFILRLLDDYFSTARKHIQPT